MDAPVRAVFWRLGWLVVAPVAWALLGLLWLMAFTLQVLVRAAKTPKD